MTRPSVDDLLGGTPTPPKPRPKLPEFSQAQYAVLPAPPPRDIPVGITWLANAFRMDRETVKRRLGSCQPKAQSKGGSLLYDFLEASAYLVTPKIDWEAVARSTRFEDLPTHLQKAFWEAKNAEARYKRTTGELWHTDDVREVLGDVFTHFKTTFQLFSETLERETVITSDQRARLYEMSDALQDDLHERLVKMPKQKQTENFLSNERDDPEDGV